MTASKAPLRYDIRAMQSDDLAAAHALSRAVGWPHRHEDWDFVLSVGQGLVAYSDHGLAATAMQWSYDRQVTRIGMVIVDPAIQRAGLGRVMMHGILDQTGDPTVILNATAQGEKLYRQLGFADFGTIIQHQGASFATTLVPVRTGQRLRPAGRSDRLRLIELDAMACGVTRDAVIEALLDVGDAVILDDGGDVAGFAFFRRFGRGYTIGPVIAQDTEAAKALIAHWIGLNPGIFIRIDVPMSSDLSHWLDELGLSRASQVTSMIRGPRLSSNGPLQVFGILNQALG